MKKYIAMILTFGLMFSAMMYAGGDETLADVLRGQYSGVNVSSLDGSIEGGFKVNVRGVNSIRSSAQPLFIVDGAYVSNSLDETLNSFWKAGDGFRMSVLNSFLFLNVRDIESIEVLKNVSATAIYGSEGANGVVIIKTRNAVKDGLQVAWNSSLSLLTPTVDSDCFKSSLAHDHNISVSMSKGGVRYHMSGWWRDLNGTIPSTGAAYGGLRLNFETNANRYINFGLNTSISVGDVSTMTGTSWLGQSSYVLNSIDSDYYPSDSPSGWINDHDDDSRDNRALASAWMKINFLKSLFWKTTFGVDYQSNTRYIWYGNSTSYGLSKNGAAAILSTNILRYRINSALTFNRYFNSHHLNLSLGYESDGLWLKSNTMNGSDFFNHSLRAKGLNLGAAKADIFEIDNNHDRSAAFITASYDWNGIVGADAVFRAQVLRKFHDWTPSCYPSGELWADLHKAFIPEVKAVSKMRLTAGYGVAGYDRSMAYDTMHKWVPQSMVDVPEGVENYFKALNELRTKELNLGLQLGFMSDRLTLGVTYYDRKTDDRLTMYSFGEQKEFYWEKASRKELSSHSSLISNKGFEFDLGASVLNQKNLSWRIDANLAYNVNQLYDVAAEDVPGLEINSSDVANRNILGMQVGALYGYEYRYGKLMDKTGDGLITSNDRCIIGSPIPAFTGGLTSTLRYKDFIFEMAFEGAAGHDILNLSRMYTDSDPVDVISDKYVERGDYLRLSEVGFSYDIPLNKKKIESLRLSLKGSDLYTFTGYSGWNPDVNTFGSSPMSAGLDYGAWPVMRTFMLGVSVKF